MRLWQGKYDSLWVYNREKQLIVENPMKYSRLKHYHDEGSIAYLKKENLSHREGFYYLRDNYSKVGANHLIKIHIRFENYKQCGLHVLNIVNELNLFCIFRIKLLDPEIAEAPERLIKHAPITIYFDNLSSVEDILLAIFKINNRLEEVSNQLNLIPVEGVALSDDEAGKYCSLTISSHSKASERVPGWEAERKKMANDCLEYIKIKELYPNVEFISKITEYIENKKAEKYNQFFGIAAKRYTKQQKLDAARNLKNILLDDDKLINSNLRVLLHGKLRLLYMEYMYITNKSIGGETLLGCAYLAFYKYSEKNISGNAHIIAKKIADWKNLDENALVDVFCDLFQHGKDGWSEHSFQSLVAWQIYHRYNDRSVSGKMRQR